MYVSKGKRAHLIMLNAHSFALIKPIDRALYFYNLQVYE